MDPNRWARIEEIYHALLSQPPELRTAALAEACSSDAAMRDELESLLAARAEAGDFLSLSMRGQVVAGGLQTPLPVPGEVLGSYHILAEAGAGAMGHVYRALDTRLEREVALKVLPPHFARDSERATRFRVEAKAASALNHPNIVTIYEIGEAAETLFIAMEWIEGVTLRERIGAGQLPFEDMVDIAKQCAAGLGRAHSAGIIHRDIKPQNIMIRSDGLVKLLDFGLARMNQSAAGSLTATDSGSVLGTPLYMSPEQAIGRKLDARTDIFSMGVVLYEMAYGRPAFPGDTPAQVFAQLLSPEPATVASSGIGLDPVIVKALQKDPEKRYATIDALAEDLKALAPGGRAPVPEHRRKSRRAWLAAAAAVAGLLVSTAVLYAPWRRQPVLSDRDTILLADFVNQTGDPVFDVTLKEGLAVQLEQSPYLDVFSDDRVRSRLRFMRRSQEEPITQQIAREICQREGLKALVTGVIAPLGSHYGITLTAIDSLSGNTLAQTQVEAQGKEKVLHALSQAASTLRRQLGESVRSLQKFDAMSDVTTPSLEALRAYSLGDRERVRGNYSEAIALYRRATELDPGFATAYRELAVAYNNTRQHGLATEAGAKAYELREHASERERLRILSEYYSAVTGDSEKRIETSKLQLQLFPRDTAAHSNLAVAYNSIGRFGDALEQTRAAVQQDPSSVSRWAVLGNTLIRVGRFSEAADVYRQAFEKHLDAASFHHGLFRIAFVSGDEAEMRKQVEWAERQGREVTSLDWQSSAAAAAGQRRRAEQFARHIEELASQNGAAEGGIIAQAALRSAALGYCGTIKDRVSKALSVERDVVARTRGALALAWCGESARAESLQTELAVECRNNSAVNGIWRPAIRAAISIKKGAAQSAVEALETARYEAAGEFWPQYIRGLAFLQLRRPAEAATEFRKILDHRGQDPISPLYPLAKLGAARASMLQRDIEQAQRMYEEFLAEWKNADSDLPELAEAKHALARLSGEHSTHGSVIQ